MSPIPDENDGRSSKDDPGKIESDEFDNPDHILYPDGGSSTDDESDGDVNDGYTLLPQEPDEGEENYSDQEDGVDETTTTEADFPAESLTELHGAGVDMTEALAKGSIHPAFLSKFPDNKVPTYLQVPDLPKDSKREMLWNQPRETSHIEMDSAQASKVKSAMAGFQLPVTNIPEWAQNIPEDQWKQQLILRLTNPNNTFQSSVASLSVSHQSEETYHMKENEDTINSVM